jgi:hypothetical protein
MILSNAPRLLCCLALAAVACEQAPPVQTAESAAQSPQARPPAPARAGRCASNFTTIDRDADGAVSLEEFVAVPHRRRSPEAAFRARDADQNGLLTEAELCADCRGMGRMGGRGRRARFDDVGTGTRCSVRFEELDEDGDGKVTRSEFGSVAHFCGDAGALFDARDGDADGVLTQIELCSGR